MFFLNNSNLEGVNFKPAVLNISKTALCLRRCSSGVRLKTISSRQMIYQVKCNSPRWHLINLWKVVGHWLATKDILSQFQNPKGPTVKAVSGLASSSNSICQYPDFRSNVQNKTAPCWQSKLSSILGSAHLSLIFLLLNLHRSMETLSSQSLFLANTTTLAHELKLFLIAPISTTSRRFFPSSKRWGDMHLHHPNHDLRMHKQNYTKDLATFHCSCPLLQPNKVQMLQYPGFILWLDWVDICLTDAWNLGPYQLAAPHR